MARLDRLTVRAVVVVTAATLLGAPPADREAIALGAEVPLFDLAGIAPGDSGSATLVVTNPRDGAVTVRVGVASLRTDDNGCVEPERAAGDETCASGGGELQDELWLTLAVDSAERVLGSRTLATWAERPATDPIDLSPHASRTYELSYRLPLESSNLTQSDLVEFRLRVELEGDSDVGSEPPSVVVPATPSLPSTGAPTGAPVMLGLLLVLAGIAALRSQRPGKDRSAASAARRSAMRRVGAVTEK